MKKLNSTIKLALLLSTGMLAAGCAGTPDKVELLETAKSAYTRANEDPVVAKHAALELDDASKSLRKAEKVWQKGEDKDVVEHYAYIAEKRVAIAEFRAETLDNRSQLDDMKLERKSVQLEVRAGEVDAARQEAVEMAAKATELQRQMTELQAIQTERGMVLTLGDVLFDLNKASLKPGSEQKITKVAEFMNKYPEKKVIIEGHTDSTGDDEYNRNLSAERAFTVKSALVMRGVAANRVISRGLGETMPVASNDNSLGRQQNRRVEIIFEKDIKSASM